VPRVPRVQFGKLFAALELLAMSNTNCKFVIVQPQPLFHGKLSEANIRCALFDKTKLSSAFKQAFYENKFKILKFSYDCLLFIFGII
jgi:hypothetical protein